MSPQVQILQLRQELIQTQQVVLSYQLRDVVAELAKHSAQLDTPPVPPPTQKDAP